jgi:parvulin-like peptidyl-prolyl isomerase
VALLKDVDAREKKGEVNAFQTTAMKESKDQLSAPMGGDLRFLSREELSKAYSPELATAAFELKNPGDKAGPIETPAGIELVKLQVKTVALNRTFDESKDQIRGRMARERRSHEYDDWMKKLRANTQVTVNDAELEKVVVEGAPQGQPGITPPVGMNPMQGHVPNAPPPPLHPAGTPPTAASKIGGN